MRPLLHVPRYAEMVYYGYWFAPERLMLQAAIDEATRAVTGTARLRLYRATATEQYVLDEHDRRVPVPL